MRFYVGITDEDWYRSLMRREAEEANFWRPGKSPFRYLELGGLFLFKLRHPKNAIVGGGHFIKYLQLPVSVAWQAFREDNGVPTEADLLHRNVALSHVSVAREDPEIGCIVLGGLFFFDEPNWITAPTDFAKNIVSGKGYNLTMPEGERVWNDVRHRIEFMNLDRIAEQPVMFAESLGQRRLGQGAFRALVTDAYGRRCAMTGERTLPVLQAAHIQPVTRQGIHSIQNGMLLRSDLHILFDQGLLTIDPDYRVQVSPQIKHRYTNGKDYYAMHGQELRVIPENEDLRPSRSLLGWHQSEVFLS